MAIRLFAREALTVLFVTLFVPLAAGAQQRDSIDDQAILDALSLKAGMTACEIGAGSGELTIKAARMVGDTGKVYTSELGEESIQRLRRAVEESGLSQIVVVAGDPNKTNFPDKACDVVFMRNVYHHFDDPTAMDASIAAALKPGGRVAVADFNPRETEAETPRDRDAGNHHGVSPEAVSRELKAAGFESVSSTDDRNGHGFMVVFAKPGQ